MASFLTYGSPITGMLNNVRNIGKRIPKGTDMSIDSHSPSGEMSGLYAANPYSDVDYKQSSWQNFLSWLGFRTDADAYKENMQLQSNEYEAALAEKQYDNAYNSPAAQVARMRDAGLNPDLLGTSGVEASQPMKEDGNPPVASASDLGSFSQAVSTAGSFVSHLLGDMNGIIAFSSGIQDLKRRKIDNESLDLGLLNDYLNVGNSIIDLAPTSKDDFSEFDILSDRVDNIVSSLGLPPKVARRLKDSSIQQLTSLTSLSRSYKNLSDYANSVKEAALDAGSKYYSEGNAFQNVYLSTIIEHRDELFEAEAAYLAALAKYQKSVIDFNSSAGVPQAQAQEAAASARAGISQANFDKTYYDEANNSGLAGSQVDSEKSKNELDAAENKVNLAEERLLNDLTEKLDSEYQKGNQVAGIGTMFLGEQRAKRKARRAAAASNSKQAGAAIAGFVSRALLK